MKWDSTKCVLLLAWGSLFWAQSHQPSTARMKAWSNNGEQENNYNIANSTEQADALGACAGRNGQPNRLLRRESHHCFQNFH